MPRGKLRSQDELANFAKSINRRRRPLLKEVEKLNIAAGVLEYVLGGDDPFAEPVKAQEDTQPETESEEVEAEAE